MPIKKQPESGEGSKRLQHQIKELENNWKRALADYKNLEQRTEKLRIDAMLFASASLIRKLLKVLDDLSAALVHHPREAWIQSLRNDLTQMLSQEGLNEIEAVGKPFDPLLMECVQRVQGEEGRVVRVLLTGYKLHDSVLRPAKVEVGTRSKKQEAMGKEQEIIP